MRVLVFNKDHPRLNTGYAKCLRELWIKRLSKKFNIAAYITVPPIRFFDNYNGITLYTPYLLSECDIACGGSSLLTHYTNFKADILFTQLDAYVLKEVSELAKTKKIEWVAYLPIDYYPIPDYFIKILEPAKKIISMGKWIQKELNAVDYLYHGIDTTIYKPLGNTKNEIRRKYKNNLVKEGEFLITIIQKNATYKAWVEQLKGIKLFIDSNRDIKTKIYIHSFSKGNYHLPTLISLFGLENYCILCNQYKYYHCLYTEEDMSLIYNLADVNLSVSAEGFGLPIIEAMGCGTPSIVLNFGTPKELLDSLGLNFKVNIKEYKLTEKYVWKPYPKEEEIVRKLEYIANVGSDKYLTKLVNFSKQFSWDKIAEKLRKILEK